MIRDQFILDISDELIVDLFAGGGGMSVAIEQALGRHVDIAINHNEDALSMHQANHPQTQHFVADVYEVCPRGVTRGRPVGLLHLSPDCTHHSQASAGQPRDTKIRSLAWVGVRWAGQVRPRVITLENVRQIRKWGPLIAKRDAATGRVVRRDRTVAAPGERVPVQDQYLMPDPKREGETWRSYKAAYRRLGYEFGDADMIAADYGAPTSRNRLFAVTRRDGVPVSFPSITHAKKATGRVKAHRQAWECLDFSLPCPSIFEREKQLAEATLARIAEGIVREVLEKKEPFIVPVTHAGARPVHSVKEPFRTITGANRGELGLVSPCITPIAHYNGTNPVHSVQESLRTVTAHPKGGSFALVSAFLAQMNGGKNTTPGHDLRGAVSTVSTKGSQQQLICAHLAHLQNNCAGRDVRDPLKTIHAEGQHHGVVECTLSPEDEAGALRVAAFLIRYYSHGGQWGDLRDPMSSVTTRDRLALVTVTIHGWPFVISDVGLRMLIARELYNAQGFPARYVIDRGHDGRVFTKTKQVRMCGNSVSPPPAVALIRHVVPELHVQFGDERRELAIA